MADETLFGEEADSVSVVLRSGVLMLSLVLILGHLFSSQPLDHLGIRPHGRGLWTWLEHHMDRHIGVWGYDPILGCWSPLVRAGLHASAAVLLWAFLLYINSDDCCDPFYSTMISAFVLYGFYCHYQAHHSPNVSFVGGPRRRQRSQQRQPKWKSLIHGLDKPKTLRCAVADDSHEVTTRRFQSIKPNGALSGEAAGRQIWTTVLRGEKVKERRGVDEKMVLEMAAGGRGPGFNPAENPNRCVCE